jgi:hypothetical protein
MAPPTPVTGDGVGPHLLMLAVAGTFGAFAFDRRRRLERSSR